jgi:hypothetical protein
MALGERLDELRRDFGRGGSVRRKIFVQDQDAHADIREKS